jgi:hypothetical protein
LKNLQQTCQIIITKNSKLFGALIMMLFIQSCLKEEYDKVEHKTNYYYLTAAQLNQTPYFTNPTFDTISFASDKGDTLTFVKTKTDTTWYCEKGWGNPNTGYDKDCYQTIHNTYATIKGNGSFDVKHSKDGNNFYNRVLPNLVVIKFNETYFLVQDYYIGSKIGGTFYESLIKGNNTYKNVIDIFHNLNDSSVALGYINKDFGLFSINDKLNDTEYFILK